MAERNSPLARKLIEDGLRPHAMPAAPEAFDNLGDARREVSCITLDIRDASNARGPAARRKHLADALGRAHRLVHMLKAAQAAAGGPK